MKKYFIILISFLLINNQIVLANTTPPTTDYSNFELPADEDPAKFCKANPADCARCEESDNADEKAACQQQLANANAYYKDNFENVDAAESEQNNAFRWMFLFASMLGYSMFNFCLMCSCLPQCISVLLSSIASLIWVISEFVLQKNMRQSIQKFENIIFKKSNMRIARKLDEYGDDHNAYIERGKDSKPDESSVISQTEFLTDYRAALVQIKNNVESLYGVGIAVSVILGLAIIYAVGEALADFEPVTFARNAFCLIPYVLCSVSVSTTLMGLTTLDVCLNSVLRDKQNKKASEIYNNGEAWPTPDPSVTAPKTDDNTKALLAFFDNELATATNYLVKNDPWGGCLLMGLILTVFQNVFGTFHYTGAGRIVTISLGFALSVWRTTGLKKKIDKINDRITIIDTLTKRLGITLENTVADDKQAQTTTTFGDGSSSLEAGVESQNTQNQTGAAVEEETAADTPAAEVIGYSRSGLENDLNSDQLYGLDLAEDLYKTSKEIVKDKKYTGKSRKAVGSAIRKLNRLANNLQKNLSDKQKKKLKSIMSNVRNSAKKLLRGVKPKMLDLTKKHGMTDADFKKISDGLDFESSPADKKTVKKESGITKASLSKKGSSPEQAESIFGDYLSKESSFSENIDSSKSLRKKLMDKEYKISSKGNIHKKIISIWKIISNSIRRFGYKAFFKKKKKNDKKLIDKKLND